MAKSQALLAAMLLLAARPAGAETAILGSDAAACRPGAPGPAALVTVHGFKDREGRLRLQDYRGDPGEYLASGRYLRRQELPMTSDGDMRICLVLPAPGRYAIVALHDRDMDGKLSIFADGVGFSNDPRLGLGKPPAARTLHDFGPGVTPIRITMNYLRGLSVRPLAP